MKLIDLHERFARSLVAGVVASVILFSLNLFSYYVIHLSKRRFINYASLIIFGRKFNDLAEEIFSSIAQISFASGLIVISSYLIFREKKQNQLLRGLFVGIGSWFAIMVFAYTKGIHKLLPIDLGSAISFMVTSSIWGVTGAWVLDALDRKYDEQTDNQLERKQRTTYHVVPAPAMKKEKKERKVRFVKP